MKTTILLAVAIALATTSLAQKKGEKPPKDSDQFNVEKSKVVGKMTGLALAQITIEYKVTSTAKTQGQDATTGTKAGAKISAYLETTDGPLTDDDFQEITDHFYGAMQRALKAQGYDTVAWNAITATDFYKNGALEEAKEKEEKGENAWMTSTAHHGNKLHGKELAFAFGKIKKASAFCEEVNATAGFFYVTVDFADVLVNIDISTAGSGLYYPKTQTKKINSAVRPVVKVIENRQGWFPLFWNAKSQGEIWPMWHRGIASDMVYQDNIGEDASRLKNSMWAFRKEMTPVVIETTRAKYKAAAKDALNNYALAFVEKATAFRKD